MVEQIPLDLGYRATLSGDAFLVAECNAQAVQWLDSWPDWPGSGLIVHGPSGCGKTHLAHAFAERCGARMIAPGAVGQSTPAKLLGTHMAVIVDDADRCTDERGLLHLYNHIVESGRHMLLTAALARSAWPMTLADLVSRLGALPAVAIGAPDDALLGAVLVKLFHDRQLPVSQDVIAYLLARMTRSFAAAHAVVAEIDASAMAAHRRVTIPLVRDVLGHSGRG